MELTNEQLYYLKELAELKVELINAGEIDTDSDIYREMEINATTIAEINDELRRNKLKQ